MENRGLHFGMLSTAVSNASKVQSGRTAHTDSAPWGSCRFTIVFGVRPELHPLHIYIKRYNPPNRGECSQADNGNELIAHPLPARCGDCEAVPHASQPESEHRHCGRIAALRFLKMPAYYMTESGSQATGWTVIDADSPANETSRQTQLPVGAHAVGIRLQEDAADQAGSHECRDAAMEPSIESRRHRGKTSFGLFHLPDKKITHCVKSNARPKPVRFSSYSRRQSYQSE
jgi:hypothetical protein